jgi:tellurite resistance protein TehA-like permease
MRNQVGNCSRSVATATYERGRHIVRLRIGMRTFMEICKPICRTGFAFARQPVGSLILRNDAAEARRSPFDRDAADATRSPDGLAHAALAQMLARQILAWSRAQVEGLYPGCFAIVMATGIISNALFAEGHRHVSDAFLVANIITYPLLAVLTLVRLARFPHALWSDLTNRELVFSFFTIVAASCVFGEGIFLRGGAATAVCLWLFALAAWVALICAGFAVMTFSKAKVYTAIIQDGWLLAIVGTEALSVLGTTIAPATAGFAPTIFVLAHALWGIGLELYAIYIALLVYRLFFFDLRSNDISPALWVVMGAAAISTDAGSAILLIDSGVPFLHAMRPFVIGVTLLTWAWATFWIPLLLMLDFWKHAVCRDPLTYTPLLWSAVFPLGMYSMATVRLSRASDLAALRTIGDVVVWIAIAAWIAALGALVVACWRDFRESARSDHAGVPLG